MAMANKTIRLTENELHNIVKQITEGLIMSYDMDLCKSYLMKRFPNIRKIESLDYNPYIEQINTYKPQYNDFVGISIDPNNIDNFKEIIDTTNNLLGWFTGYVELRVKTRNGYIPYVFYNFNGQFVYLNKRGPNIYLEQLLKQKPELTFFSMVLEAKFGEQYHQKPNETFYHATEANLIDKIMKNGLTPKSKGNFPERIYLGKNIAEIKDMVGPNLQDMVILKVDVSNIKLFKLYRDQRNPTAVFTYNNIPPSQIEVVGNLV